MVIITEFRREFQPISIVHYCKYLPGQKSDMTMIIVLYQNVGSKTSV